MAEYIELEAVRAALQKYGFQAPDMTVTELVEDELTAADVAPVRHARWVEYPRAHYFKCSECKYTVPYRKAISVNGKQAYNYRPNCGARMDGDKE